MTKAVLLDATLPASKLGEGAYWDDETGSVYWVDIAGRTVHRYTPRDRSHQYWSVSNEVSFAFPKHDRLVLCMSDGIYDFDPATGCESPVALLDLPNHHRLNDGKIDAQGRLWVGTINTSSAPLETAALYVLRDDRLQEVESGYINANGKAWSPDGNIFYHADTARSIIWEYDYEPETGLVSNKRVFVRVDEDSPDGLCVDRQGNVFAAIYGGARVDVFSFRGDLLRSIEVPVPNPTSCVLAGPDEKTLLITTAFDGMSEQQHWVAPLSGQIFKFDCT
jgi:D-xylonolactonase